MLCGKRALAVIGLCTLVFDIAMDFLYGIDLYKRCHLWFAGAVFLFIGAPGWLNGAYELWNDWTNWKNYLKFLLGPLVFIPTTIYWNFMRVYDPKNEDYKKKSIKSKLLEVIFEAFPQLVLNLMISISFQIRDLRSYLSLLTSLASILMALNQREEKFLHKVLFRLANIGDILLRLLFLALSFTVVWGGGIWFTLAYSFITITILKCWIYPDKRWHFIGKKASAFFFVSGYYRKREQDRKFRFYSKLVFNILAIGFVVYFHVQLMHVDIFEINCENYCNVKNGSSFGVIINGTNGTQVEGNCGSFNLNPNLKEAYVYIIYALIGWSFLEGCLEQTKFKIMFYNCLPLKEDLAKNSAELEALKNKS